LLLLNARRPVVFVSEILESTKGATQTGSPVQGGLRIAMEDDGGEWECARCTLCNAAGDGCCAACGAARGAASASEASDSDSDAQSDGDYEMATGMDGPDEAAHTVEVHVAKRRWEETEGERVKARDEAAARAGCAAVASFDEKKAAQAQIFTSQARRPGGPRERGGAQRAVPPAGPNPGEG